jgi:2-polyprenyl-3-methyl-5-hydroxy-6-metoxy-1,4-benzoquinol methylase
MVEIDWLELWRELIIANPHTSDSSPMKRYRAHSHLKKERPDPLLDFVIQSLAPGMTVIDIGAGNGRWTIPLAKKALFVTAVEPAADMLSFLEENIKTGPSNIRLVQASWEETEIEMHDVSVSAHSIYSSSDFALFVRKMERCTRKTCYLALRLPPVDGVIGELSKIIYGRAFDSVNAVVAYNALYSLGIYAGVLVEKEIYPWVNDTLEQAFVRAKRHLQLESNPAYDNLIKEKLTSRLIVRNNLYVWPDGMRSALLWWNPVTNTR